MCGYVKLRIWRLLTICVRCSGRSAVSDSRAGPGLPWGACACWRRRGPLPAVPMVTGPAAVTVPAGGHGLARGRREGGHEVFRSPGDRVPAASGCRAGVPRRLGPAGEQRPRTARRLAALRQAAGPPAMVPRSAEVASHRTGRSLLLTAGRPVMGGGQSRSAPQSGRTSSGLRDLHASGPVHVRETAPTLRWFRRPMVTS